MSVRQPSINSPALACRVSGKHEGVQHVSGCGFANYAV